MIEEKDALSEPYDDRVSAYFRANVKAQTRALQQHHNEPEGFSLRRPARNAVYFTGKLSYPLLLDPCIQMPRILTCKT
jgi:hypothetical protein